MSLEVGIQGESFTVLLATDRCHDTRLLVFANALLEEIGLSLKRNEFHPIKGILDFIELWMTKCYKQPVCHKLDVRRHQLAVHANEIAREGFTDECLLCIHGPTDDVMYHIVWQLML